MYTQSGIFLAQNIDGPTGTGRKFCKSIIYYQISISLIPLCKIYLQSNHFVSMIDMQNLQLNSESR